MASGLEAIFGELGLAQYLNAFVEQGFDEWDIILDIQESDLELVTYLVLNSVIEGAQQKLQRRIANARGISPSTSLVTPGRPAAEDVKTDGSRPEPSRPETTHEVQGVAKRKYRRHPKPDENAPERPPSAYVLFSNKMREDLKSQNLSFTEIAKLVGENWQNLAPMEKEGYESQANADKENYHRDLMEYKKTAYYKKYIQYLQEFKEKQAKQNQGGTISDVSKRPKLEPARLRNGSGSSNTATPGVNTPSGSGSGSGSERLQGSEPPPSRKERMNSIVSIPESQHSATPTLLSQPNSNDEAMSSPRGGQYDPGSPHEPHRYPRRQGSWREGSRAGDAPHQHLPSLSDMLDDGMRGISTSSGEGHPYSTGFVAANHARLVPELPNGMPPAPRVPLLRHDQSSNSSVCSTSPAMSFARTPGEGSLPIHALLSHQTVLGPGVATPGAFDRGLSSSMTASPSPTDPVRLPFGHGAGPRGYGSHGVPSTSQLVNAEQSGAGGALVTQDLHIVMSTDDRPGRARLDGVSALLRAGEIVERHDRDDRI
ncbi:hypothetical protein AK830_g11491 [Neonectria ditissima]|uniref:HMG box domain-containing protein n=1 Tax=Neonectria ditissima TaxID=78410 RepID=A0A0P7B2W7_9HYPO|nr:hypothetical protein AK830_g11491 [Neonectria ditissima]